MSLNYFRCPQSMLHNGCSVTGVAAAAVSRELPPCCGLMLTQAGVKPGPGPGSDTDGADQDAVQCTATVQPLYTVLGQFTYN